MSKAAKIVGIVAAVVAVVATAGMAIAPLLGYASTFAGISLSTIATVASVVSAVASAISVATQKPPDMKGAVNQVLIGANMPVPYSMGRTYVAGNVVYDDSNGTNNIDRTMIMVGSIGGPIDSFEAFQSDFSTLPFSLSSGGRIEGKATDSWYGAGTGFLWVNSRKGLLPDTALTPFSGRAAFRDWGAASKLSGMPAWSATMAFDKKGERWTGGIPAFGMIGKWVKTYDPRKDSSYLGGSGPQRWDDESSWEYGTAGTGYVAQGENPALHALAYALGRHENGIKVVGVGLDEADINVARFVEAANICDANGWTIGGTIYEGPGISKWDNLKHICAAFGAQPIWSGGLLDLKLNKPVVAIDTITRDDLVGDSISVPAMKSFRDRINTIVPRYRSEPHRWDYVQSDAISNATYVTEDGETKTKEVQYDLVQSKDQAAQLAAYDLVNGREFGPIELSCKPRLMLLRVGEAVNLDLASILDDAALPAAQPVIVTSRTVEPGTGTIRFAFESETAAKHAWVLARTGTAPPTPTILAPGAIDQAVNTVALTEAQITQLILASGLTGMTFSVTVPAGGNTQVTISSHNRVYTDKTVSVNSNSGPVAVAAAAGDLILGYYDDPGRLGGPVTYQYLVLAGGVGDASPAYATPANPYRHNVFAWSVPSPTDPTSGGSDAGSGGGGGGGGGGAWNHTNNL